MASFRLPRTQIARASKSFSGRLSTDPTSGQCGAWRSWCADWGSAISARRDRAQPRRNEPPLLGADRLARAAPRSRHTARRSLARPGSHARAPHRSAPGPGRPPWSGAERHRPATGPAPRVPLLGGWIADLEPRRVDILRGDPSLMEGNTTVRTDRVLAKPRPGAGGAVKDNEDLPSFRGDLDPKTRRSAVPIDDILRRGRERVDHALGQLDARHWLGLRRPRIATLSQNR